MLLCQQINEHMRNFDFALLTDEQQKFLHFTAFCKQIQENDNIFDFVTAVVIHSKYKTLLILISWIRLQSYGTTMFRKLQQTLQI